MLNRKHIWTIVALVAGYITLQLVADVAAAKIMQVGRYTLPAGSLVFALTFTWRDLLHKRLGKEWARAAIATAALCNLFMVAYFLLAIRLPHPPFWANQVAFESTLGVVWRITLASIVAEVVSELIDTEVYHHLMQRISVRRQYLRVLGSNAVSLPIDSLVFAAIAFSGTMPLAALWSLVWGQVVFKAAVTLVSLPLIYCIPERPLNAIFLADFSHLQTR